MDGSMVQWYNGTQEGLLSDRWQVRILQWARKKVSYTTGGGFESRKKPSARSTIRRKPSKRLS